MHIPKKPIWKKATHTIWLQLYDILEKGSYGDSEKKKKESVAARGWRERGWIGGTQRVFSAVKLFCIIPQWWIHVIKHLWKLKECTTPRVNSNILSVDSSVVTNVPLWCDIFMAGGQYYVCRGGGQGYMGTLYLQLSSAVKLKLLWKSKGYSLKNGLLLWR